MRRSPCCSGGSCYHLVSPAVIIVLVAPTAQLCLLSLPTISTVTPIATMHCALTTRTLWCHFLSGQESGPQVPCFKCSHSLLMVVAVAGSDLVGLIVPAAPLHPGPLDPPLPGTDSSSATRGKKGTSRAVLPNIKAPRFPRIAIERTVSSRPRPYGKAASPLPSKESSHGT